MRHHAWAGFHADCAVRPSVLGFVPRGRRQGRASRSSTQRCRCSEAGGIGRCCWPSELHPLGVFRRRAPISADGRLAVVRVVATTPIYSFCGSMLYLYAQDDRPERTPPGGAVFRRPSHFHDRRFLVGGVGDRGRRSAGDPPRFVAEVAVGRGVDLDQCHSAQIDHVMVWKFRSASGESSSRDRALSGGDLTERRRGDDGTGCADRTLEVPGRMDSPASDASVRSADRISRRYRPLSR